MSSFSFQSLCDNSASQKFWKDSCKNSRTKRQPLSHRSSCRTHERQYRGRLEKRLPIGQLIAKQNDDDTSQIPIEKQDIVTLLSSVTDAEALLACRAHLQRTNQLDQWTAGKERKLKRQLAELQAKQSDAVGFFWEEPDELVFFDRKKLPSFSLSDKHKRNFQFIDRIEDGYKFPEEGKEEDAWGTIFNSRSNIQQSADLLPGLEIIEDDEIWENAHILPEEYSSSATYFKLDESTPSTSHNRRSNATKRTFSDPEWKAAWYDRRWGGKVRSKQTNKQRSLEERMRSPHMDRFLSHPKLSAMDEGDIAEAIRTYLRSNRMHGLGRRQTLLRRKEVLTKPVDLIFLKDAKDGSPPSALPSPLIPRDSLFEPDLKVLDEQRKRRAENAVKIYQRRIENSKGTKTKRSKSNIQPLSQELTPNDAAKRIERMLDEPEAIYNNPVLLSDLKFDVELVLKPSKFPQRKDLLRRVLSAIFDLRGKCVPTESQNGIATGYIFVTKCSISVLGHFVLQTINEREEVLHKKEQTTN